MNYTEIIEAQVALLADLNQQLAEQATPEAAQEIRDNIRLIAELLQENRYQDMESLLHIQGGILDDLEERIIGLEEAVFPEESVKDSTED